ncbi:hypothetical protein R3P38DRAFT_3374348 [Favolaschia claudopus]|uniref:Uncharacterized protein n=1 Tax=Favolaschia claudopus TaxID=2862362 RepID=A0AAV9ZNA7_9AGAR
MSKGERARYTDEELEKWWAEEDALNMSALACCSRSNDDVGDGTEGLRESGGDETTECEQKILCGGDTAAWSAQMSDESGKRGREIRRVTTAATGTGGYLAACVGGCSEGGSEIDCARAEI